MNNIHSAIEPDHTLCFLSINKETKNALIILQLEHCSKPYKIYTPLLSNENESFMMGGKNDN